MRLALFPGVLLLTMGCAGAQPELWPPVPGSPSHDIIVSVDSWHAAIAIEKEHANVPSQSSALSPQNFLYEEWSYAEQAWYLEGRQGFTGVLRALFWPSVAVVEVGTHTRPWSERTPDPPAEQFRFTLSAEGYLRLRAFLEASRRSATPLRAGAGSAFYPARRAYSLFHQCHQYAAHALRAAGLPMSPLWALTRSLFVAQLRRAEGMADEQSRHEETRPACFFCPRSWLGQSRLCAFPSCSPHCVLPWPARDGRQPDAHSSCHFTFHVRVM